MYISFKKVKFVHDYIEGNLISWQFLTYMHWLAYQIMYYI